MSSRSAIPLLITILRLFLGPVFLWMMGWEHKPVFILAAMVGFSVYTDWLDGHLARRWNVVSTIGKLLDPFADALFCMIVFVAYAREGWMPWWIVWVLVGREALVTFVLRPLALWRGVVVAAKYTGKVKTVTQFVVMLMVLAVAQGLLARIPGFTWQEEIGRAHV